LSEVASQSLAVLSESIELTVSRRGARDRWTQGSTPIESGCADSSAGQCEQGRADQFTEVPPFLAEESDSARRPCRTHGLFPGVTRSRE
jgi:hypothetical protein